MVAAAASSAVIPMAALSAPAATPKISGFAGLKSNFVAASKAGSSEWSQKTVANGSRVSCMITWEPFNNKRYETLSFLPPLSAGQISKEIDYMLAKGWFPCVEFSDVGVVHRTFGTTPGYYDGRYWTMWKLPMFGCNDAAQVLREIEECKKAYPQCYIRILGFDNKRQVQCVQFLVYKP